MCRRIRLVNDIGGMRFSLQCAACNRWGRIDQPQMVQRRFLATWTISNPNSVFKCAVLSCAYLTDLPNFARNFGYSIATA